MSNEILKEMNNMQEVNDFLRTDLGGRTLEEVKIPRNAPKEVQTEMRKANAQVKLEVSKFKKKWEEGFKVICVKDKCLCGREFWQPQLQFVKEDNPTYINAKEGKQQTGPCGMCHGLIHRMRELNLQPAYAKGIMRAIWESLKGVQLIQEGKELKIGKDLDMKHLMDIGYKAEVVLFEPKEGKEAAEKKWQEEQERKKKQQEELEASAKKEAQ
jgi:hypothetical protein